MLSETPWLEDAVENDWKRTRDWTRSQELLRKELEQVQELELEEDESPPQEDDGDNVGIEIGLWARIHPHLG